MQSAGGSIGSLPERTELLPGDFGIDLPVSGEGAEAAVRRCDHAIRADDSDESPDALGDQLPDKPEELADAGDLIKGALSAATESLLVRSLQRTLGRLAAAAKSVELARGGWLHNFSAHPWMIIAPVLGFAGLLVAVIGGAAGAAFSYWLARALLRAPGAGLPRVEGDVEPYVVVIGVAVTLVVGLVVGLLPAVLASKVSGSDVLRDTRSSGGRSALSLSKALVVVQTGIAVVLLSAAGVLSSSLYAVLRVPAGFDTADGVSMRIDLPDARYPTRALL